MVRQTRLKGNGTDLQFFDPDECSLAEVAATLEARGKHVFFAQAIDDYLDALSLDSHATILDPACGTGVVARAIARRGDVKTRITAIDASLYLVEIAKRLASDERVSERIRFLTGEPHWIIGPQTRFNVVILHMLLNRVADPGLVMKEVRRVIQPAGRLVVFDGNCGSLAHGADARDGDERTAWNRAMPESVQRGGMRVMPKFLAENGFRVDRSWTYTASGASHNFYTYIATRVS